MSKISKLHENAGIEPISEYCKHQCNLLFNDNACIGCKYIEKIDYPPFTAEKQIELINFIYIKYKKYEMFKVSNRDEVGIRASENTFYAYGIDIQNAIANFFNRNWQDLTEEEKQQIKEILE